MNRIVLLLILGSLAAPAVADDSLNVRLVGSCNTPGSAYGIALEGSHAYIGDYSGGLRVMNVSNPASPYEAGHWASPDHARGVAVAGNYAYVACGYAGLRVIDVSNPSAPAEAGACGLPDYAWGVALAGSHALVATEDAGLYAVDVSDPTLPAVAGNVNTPGNALDVAVAGDIACVADLSGGLRVIDISNPGTPVEVGFYQTPDLAYGVTCSDTFVYLGALGSLRVINIANPANPFEVGSLARADAPRGIAVSGRIAYLGQGNGGLRVVDVSDPGAPTEVGYYYQPAPNHVVASGGYAWSASTYGLRVFQYYGSGIAEGPTPGAGRATPAATVVRGVLMMPASGVVRAASSVLIDASGRAVMELAPGSNDVSHLSPGVYFVRAASGVERQASVVARVLLVR